MFEGFYSISGATGSNVLSPKGNTRIHGMLWGGCTKILPRTVLFMHH